MLNQEILESSEKPRLLTYLIKYSYQWQFMMIRILNPSAAIAIETNLLHEHNSDQVRPIRCYCYLVALWPRHSFLMYEKRSLPVPCEENTPPFIIENSSHCCVNNRISSSENQRRFISWFCLWSFWGRRAAWRSCFGTLTFAFWKIKGEAVVEKYRVDIFGFSKWTVSEVQSIWMKSVTKDIKTMNIWENKV